jgi:hypothetical protein
MKMRHRMNQALCYSPGRILCLALTTALLLQFSGEAVRAATNQLCVPQVTGLPQSDGHGGFTFPNNAPNIIQNSSANPFCAPNCSGDPAQDTGWFHAFRFRLENGTPAPDGAFQVNQQGSMLYFSFQIYNAADLNSFDYVVLGFDNHKGQYTWIVVEPFFTFGPGGSNANIPPTNLSGLPVIASWSATSLNGSGQPAWGAENFAPSWITAGTAATYSPTGSSWYVVIGIDNSNLSGPLLDSATPFGVYLDAVRSDTTNPSLSEAWQFTYPDHIYLGTTNADTTTLNPKPSVWATGSLSGACTGLFIDNGDISNSVGGVQTGNISWTQGNTFQANVHNSGIDAPKVVAVFKIANFGLPAPEEWLPIGTNVCGLPTPPAGCAAGPHPNDSVANNPSATGADVPAFTVPPGSCPEANGDGCAKITAGPWTLGADNVNYYSQPANQHECVRVDLDSLAGNATFLNNSAWNNFDFSATASEFKSYPAYVSANYAGPATQSFTLSVLQNPVASGVGQIAGVRAFEKPSSAPAAVESGTNYLNYVVEGCRLNGQTLTVQAAPTRDPNSPNRGWIPGAISKLNDCNGVGAYGYRVGHRGAVDKWHSTLSASGPGVQMNYVPGTHRYELAIPQYKKAQLVSVISPLKKGFCTKMPEGGVAFFLLGGVFVIGAIVYRPRGKERKPGKEV